MLRLLHAGLVAAGCQLGAVVIVTTFAFLSASHDVFPRDAPATPSDPETIWNSVSSLLIWAYLLIAVGLAFTSSRSVDLTADRIRAASDLMRLTRPVHALMTLVVQLVLSAIIFATFALESPPDLLIETVGYFGYGSAASIIWGATLSIGVACYGACAHAALKALKR
jgi:hypothetical protein